jgi:hypothetical protein
MVARNWGDGEKKTPCGKKNFANENATKHKKSVPPFKL